MIMVSFCLILVKHIDDLFTPTGIYYAYKLDK